MIVLTMCYCYHIHNHIVSSLYISSFTTSEYMISVSCIDYDFDFMMCLSHLFAFIFIIIYVLFYIPVI